MANSIPSDSDLLDSCLGGDQEAFGHIVTRYESLVRTVAYSATGNSALSEDVAQETFIAAWQGLASLRQPGRLRAWLCAIARNLARNSLRKRARSTLGHTVPLDSVAEPEFVAPSAHDEAVAKEREAIVWQALQSIPVVYREPMILFYREGKSVREVAETLGVGENAVKQRLLRGRKSLQKRVAAVVEETLVQTRPKRALAPLVLAALPAAGSKGGVAGLVATGFAGGSGLLKGTLGGWLLGILSSPLFLVSFLIQGAVANVGHTSSRRERRFMVWATTIGVALAVAFSITEDRLTNNLFDEEPAVARARWVLWICGGAVLFAVTIYATIRQNRIRREEEWLANELVSCGLAEPRPLAVLLLSSYLMITGGMLWLMILTLLPREWPTFGFTVAFTVSLCALATRRLVAAPHRYYAIMLQTVALMVIFSMTVFTLRWGTWMAEWAEYREDSQAAISIAKYPGYWGFSSIIVGGYLFLWQRLAWARRANVKWWNR